MVTNHTPMFLGKNVISPLFVDRFGRSLRFCHLEFYKEAISDVSWHIPVFLGGDFLVILES